MSIRGEWYDHVNEQVLMEERRNDTQKDKQESHRGKPYFLDEA